MPLRVWQTLNDVSRGVVRAEGCVVFPKGSGKAVVVIVDLLGLLWFSSATLLHLDETRPLVSTSERLLPARQNDERNERFKPKSVKPTTLIIPSLCLCCRVIHLVAHENSTSTKISTDRS